MPARHRLLAALAALALATVALAGCGGGGSGDARAILKRGFSSPIRSANVTLDLDAKLDGVSQLSQPIKVKIGGPYQSGGGRRLPRLNWDISFSGGGQAVSAGFISTGDQAFVNFQGTNYKLDPSQVAALNARLAQRNPSGARTLKSFGIDPVSWVKDPRTEGDATVAGVATDHVSAWIDVAKLFGDLNKVASRACGSVGAVRPQPLTRQQIDQIEKVVHDPTFDVYVGKKDGKIRRVSLGLSFDVPKQSQSSVRGISSGNITLSIEFAAVGEPQSIVAPTGAKPIGELTKQLSGLGALSGIGGATGGGSGGLTPPPTGGGSGGGTQGSDRYQRYAQCVSKVSPSDTAALSRCAKLLRK